MMQRIEVDFLQDRWPRSQRAVKARPESILKKAIRSDEPPIWSLPRVQLGLGLLGVGAGTSLWFGIQVVLQTFELQQRQARVAELRPRGAVSRSLLAQIQTLQPQNQALERIVLPRGSWARTLQDFAGRTPEGVQWQRLVEQDGVFTVEGLATRYDDISHFLQNLKASPLVDPHTRLAIASAGEHTVETEQSGKDASLGAVYLQFTLSGRLRQTPGVPKTNPVKP